jgi:hypothetical protein
MEVLKVITQTDLERERYEARLKVMRDELSMANWVRETEEKARAAEEVLMETLVRFIHFCQQLLKQPLTDKDTLLALSVDQLRQLADQLQQQFPPPAS